LKKNDIAIFNHSGFLLSCSVISVTYELHCKL